MKSSAGPKQLQRLVHPPPKSARQRRSSRPGLRFLRLLDSVTIARSRRHITTFYDTKEIGEFPARRKPFSFHWPLTHPHGCDRLQRHLQ